MRKLDAEGKKESKIESYLGIIAALAVFYMVVRGLVTGRLSLPGYDPILDQEPTTFIISSLFLVIVAVFVFISSIRKIIEKNRQ